MYLIKFKRRCQLWIMHLLFLTQASCDCKIRLLGWAKAHKYFLLGGYFHMSVMGLTPLETAAIWTVFGIAILGLAYAVFLRSQILREDKGTQKMQEVWNAIKDGADAYLRKQLRSILPLIGVLTIALFFSVYIVPPSPE